LTITIAPVDRMLTSLQNPLVKQFRKLHQAKGRQETGLFLLEGTHLLEEAWAIGCPLQIVCCTPEWEARNPTLWERLEQLAQRLELVSPEVLKAVATTVHPDGIVAVVERGDRLLPKDFISLGLLLETIQDPGNLGTIIRTAAAAGAEGLWLSHDSVDLDHPKVLRASAGQWFRLPMQVADLPATIAHHKKQGIQVVATSPTASLTYWQADFRSPTLILLGNEGAGLSAPIAALADTHITIPVSPHVESLNVSIAAALILYEAKRQRVISC